MATDYIIPPHLGQQPAPSIPEMFATGIKLGTQIQMQREQLQAQAQIAATQAAIRARELEAAHQLQQQRLAVESAYQNARNQLEDRQLQVQEADIQMKLKEAAQVYAAQQEYQNMIRSGVDPARAALQLGPRLGVSMAGVAQLSKMVNAKPLGSPTVEKYEGQSFLRIPREGGEDIFQQIRIPENITPGSQRAYPMTDEEGKKVPGWKLFPGEGGTMRPIRVDDEEYNRVTKEIEMLEKGPYGPQLLRGTPAEHWTGKKLEDFNKKQKRYEWLQNRFEELSTGTGSTVAPTTSTATNQPANSEAAYAQEAIRKGIPRQVVAEMYKRRTGQDLPAEIK